MGLVPTGRIEDGEQHFEAQAASARAAAAAEIESMATAIRGHSRRR